jgi:antagonist of KipI
MDRFAISAANLLVGNHESAGALECALNGPILVAEAPCLVAVTGADFGPLLNGIPMPSWTGVFMAAGDTLSFAGRRSGARCYIAVAGGLAGDRWLGSVATYLLVGRGGVHGRPLARDDRLELDRVPDLPAISGRHLPDVARPAYTAQPRLGAIPGPHAARLGKDSRRSLYGERYQVSRDADRMGYRLEGPALELRGAELISFGLTAGCLQVPQSGQPILLMADHQTAGGYPVPTVVCRADLPLAAQLLPGDSLSFEQITVEEAQARHRRFREALESIR